MPDESHIWIADDGSEAVIPIQSNLDHQMKGLLDDYLINRLKTIQALEPNVRFKLYAKVGSDGSSGHTQHQNMGE